MLLCGRICINFFRSDTNLFISFGFSYQFSIKTRPKKIRRINFKLSSNVTWNLNLNSHTCGGKIETRIEEFLIRPLNHIHSNQFVANVCSSKRYFFQGFSSRYKKSGSRLLHSPDLSAPYTFQTYFWVVSASTMELYSCRNGDFRNEDIAVSR